MASEEDLKIINHLLEIGCCKRCSMRMMCRNLNFLTPEKFIRPVNERSQYEESEHDKTKRFKTNPCIVCLDILEDSFISEMVSSIPLEEIGQYDSDTYVCFLSAPASILIREHSIKCYLKDKFPDFYTNLKTIRQLNKVWKMCISDKLDTHINKKLDDNSLLSIKFSLEYEADSEETSVMTKLDSTKFNQRLKQSRRFQGEVFSRNAIDDTLTELGVDIFKKYVNLPPSIPSSQVKCKTIEIHSEPIFIAGRYCKFSRSIGQTPWLHEDTNITDCVQDFIFRGVEKVLGYDKGLLTFSASGREDYDVRCLGKGRPFYVQIDNPKLTKIRFKMFRELEDEINKNKEISIRDMQLIKKSDLKKIKEGEQFKSKYYTALCITKLPDVEKAIEKINSHGSFEIDQQTPVRVLHRRTAADRKRAIYDMKAKKVEGKDNMFILDVHTQAGTYVKELVHGDLGRTSPSLRDIIGGEVDIIALDVNAINLDWPPEISSDQQSSEVKNSEEKENATE